MSTFFDSLPGTWQDKAVFAIGAVVFASPWFLLHTDTPTAAWNAWTVGLVFLAGGSVASVYRPHWPEFVVAFVAFWHVLAPRILGFGGDETAATVLAAVSGAAVAWLALWSAIARTRALREAAPAADTAGRKAENGWPQQAGP